MSKIMSSRWRFAILPAILLPQIPILIRFWPEISAMSPTWGLMLGQMVALLVSGILLAAIAAIVVAGYRRRRDANG